MPVVRNSREVIDARTAIPRCLVPGFERKRSELFAALPLLSPSFLASVHSRYSWRQRSSIARSSSATSQRTGANLSKDGFKSEPPSPLVTAGQRRDLVDPHDSPSLLKSTTSCSIRHRDRPRVSHGARRALSRMGDDPKGASVVSIFSQPPTRRVDSTSRWLERPHARQSSRRSRGQAGLVRPRGVLGANDESHSRSASGPPCLSGSTRASHCSSGATCSF